MTPLFCVLYLMNGRFIRENISTHAISLNRLKYQLTSNWDRHERHTVFQKRHDCCHDVIFLTSSDIVKL